MNDAQRQEHVDHVLHQRSEFAEYAKRNTRPIEWQMTESQRRDRAKQEIAMRNGTVRGIPSCFGSLS